MPLLIEECLPHTSAVVFNPSAYASPRFDQDQLIAGEDHLFWLALADGAGKIAFTPEPMAARGRGVDLYRAALDWDHPDCVRRLYFKLILHKKIKERFARGRTEQKNAAHDVAALRRGILYLLIRNSRRHPAQNAEVMRKLRAADPNFFWTLPLNLAEVLWGKATGSFAFPRG
jgi:succinoglycan biosynthesis protein ExoW